MRNLILSIAFISFFLHPALPQTKKVEGNTGSTGNYIIQFKGDYFTVERKDGYAVINLDGSVMSSGIKAPVVAFSRKLFIDHGIYFAEEAGNVVLKDIKGKKLGVGNYKDIIPFATNNTVARVPSEQGKWIVAYIDTTGKEIVRFDVRQYLSIVQPLNKSGAFSFVSLSDFLPFSEGLTPIKSTLTGKYGYIDQKLQLKIPAKFKEASPFSDGLAAVQNDDGNWGYINTEGKLVVPFTYSKRPSRFMSGLARVQNTEGHIGFINKENKINIKPQYVYATCFYKGYALVREGYDRPALLIDTAGTVIATFPKDVSYIDNSKPPVGISGNEQSEYPFYVSETLQQLVDDGKGIFTKGLSYGLLDNKGKVVLDFTYQYLSDFHGGKMFAHKSAFINNSTQNRYGIINDKGEWVIEIVKAEF
ncbi:MAG TPA: WG repeat-containing protein [Puia sp.]|nr:WG repeat-containing protein [Puia sp.]